MTPSPRFGRRSLLAGAAGLLAAGAATACGAPAPSASPASATAATSTASTSAGGPGAAPASAAAAGPPASAAQIAARADVPVLCWHQLRDWRPDDSAYARGLLICPPAAFAAQLDAVRDAGYTTVGPDAYLAHLTDGAPLPPKPILLTFDDSQGSQIVTGLPELQRRGMTATFFVMTVPLDKPNWMTRDDVRRLHGEGMTVAAHTYDHHRADRYAGADWDTQLVRPRAELEGIVGAPVVHFAYPYGAWNAGDFPHLDAAGYRTAFQLADHPVDPTRPLLTLRRSLVSSTWTGPQLLAHLSAPA